MPIRHVSNDMLFSVFVCVVYEMLKGVSKTTTMGYEKVLMALSSVGLGVILAFLLIDSIAVISNATSVYFF